MDDATRAAFCATLYRFDSPDGELLLKVDEPSATLAAWLRSHGAGCAAILTAFNPQGRRQDDAANHLAQELLKRELTAGGCTFLQGRNEDPAGKWPVEESLLVPELSLTDARALARRHDQAAFLWMDGTVTPRLIDTATAS